jgi:glycosyltransferase involved in cell wall biosynthesis/predicted  nucleic acid-binding Zn-ribbon protein
VPEPRAKPAAGAGLARRKSTSALQLSASGLGQLSALVPDRLVEPLAWVGHSPFVMWFIERWEPQQIVELGVHSGNSFFAMCQAVKRSGLRCALVGIDSWKGDAQAGFYGQETYEMVRAHCDATYGSFASLMRCQFDEAVAKFPDGSIDLLHIDGYHDYDAVRHDYQSWLPKMSEQGVILFHDTQVREPDTFGVWRLWAEIKRYYPHCEFVHSHGLGVLFVGSDLSKPRQMLRDALCDQAAFDQLNSLFSTLGTAIASERGASLRSDALVREVRELTREVELRGASLARLHGVLEAVRAERDRSAERARVASELEATLANVRAEHDSLSTRLSQLGAEMSAMDTARQDMQAQRDTAVAELDKDRDRLRQAQSAHESELNALRTRLESHRAEIESRATALARLHAIVETTRTERDDARRRAARVDELEATLANVRAERDSLSARLSQLGTAMSAMDTARQDMQAQRDTAVAELDKERDRLRQAQSAYESEVNALRTQLESHRAEIESRATALARLHAIVETTRTERDDARTRAVRVEELESTLAIVRAERDSHLARLSQVGAELSAMDTARQDMQAQRDTAVAELDKDRDRLRQAQSAHESELNALRTQLESHRAEIESRATALARLHAIVETTRTERDDARARAAKVSELEETIVSMESARNALRDLTSRLEAERNRSRVLAEIVDQRWIERVELFSSRWWRVLEPVREALTRASRHRKNVSIRRAITDALDALRGRPGQLIPTGTDPLLDVYRVEPVGVSATQPMVGVDPLFPVEPVTSRSPDNVEYRRHSEQSLAVDLLAFYLPQFHPIPENDEWWGEGFTEWRNVVRGRPRFAGHYQPKLPGALGYYDLRLPETLRRQAELARNYGVAGFVFHMYWFGGKRLLERPLDLFADDPQISLPFCVCWANENWSRRWDGLDADVLIEQQHSPEDDLNFIAEVAKYLRNPRYWRIEGKPLLIVYWANGLPDPKATAARWRDWCRNNGIGEIHLAAVEALSVADPISIGFDSTIEFPPNLMGPPPARGLSPFDPSFSGAIYDYAGLAHAAARPRASQTLRFRGICPSWDNEARKPNRGTVLAGAAPDTYQRWLSELTRHEVETRPREKRLVFVNAWNEWAEGACLEPDLRFGYAYLEATRAALSSSDPRAGGRVAVVIHDAHRHGAQLNGVSMAEELERLGYRPFIVLLGDGALKSQMAAVAAVEDWSGFANESARITSAAQALRRAGVETALVNTLVSARVLSALEAAGIRCVVLVHELPQIIQQMGLGAEVSAIASSSCPVVFAHQDVRDRFPGPQERLAGRTFIIPQGIYLKSRFLGRRDDARRFLEDRFGVPQKAPLIVNAGFGDHRKGPDLFGEVAIAVAKALPGSRFAWVGALEPKLHAKMMSMVQDAGLVGSLVMPGFTSDVDAFLAGADAMALTSREDPYPSVALEALQHGVPVVAFEGTGGVASLLRIELDSAVLQWDTQAFARRVVELASVRSSEPMARLQIRMRDECSMAEYASALVHVAQRRRGGISVIVPNYNYAKYLESRLDSIVAQGDLVREIIVIDDASSDGSVDVVRSWCRSRGTPVRLIVNQANSGNVTIQWARGARLATSDFIWLAEADDLAEPGMMARLMERLQDPQVVLAYCESRGIDEDGVVTMPNYRQWLSDLDGERWSRSWVSDGREEVARYLSVKNTIPNASAVLFRREALVDALARVLPVARRSRSCGDWLTYCEVLLKGRLAFVAEPMNLHRRHSRSVIGALPRAEIAQEIERAHAHIRELVDVSPECNARARAFLSSVR